MTLPRINLRRSLAVLFHTVVIVVCYFAAYLLRFDFAVPAQERRVMMIGFLLILAVKSTVFLAARLQQGWWRYAGIADLGRILLANVVATAFFVAAALLTVGTALPRSVYIIDFTLCVLSIAGARLAIRLYNETLSVHAMSDRRGILIYGAGAAGIALAKEIRLNGSLRYKVLGFFDDDATKLGCRFAGVSVLGTGRAAPRVVDHLRRQGQQVESIVIAMPSATGRQVRDAVSNCRASEAPCKLMPGYSALLSGKGLTGRIRDISVTDLLGREPVHLDETKIRQHISGRVVMVTGAAGSIGSELCRQIAEYGPKRLIAFDQAESEIFRIEMDFRSLIPGLDLRPRVGDIRNYETVVETMREHQVEVVFHAAAYKHVPLMEAHPLEACRNNILGTWNVVRASAQSGVTDFLMISSDKAVNPTSIMGLTKRAAELIVSAQNRPAQGLKCVSVRFGNVLASNGSVVPLFEKQIAAGGPVTVTHPDMRRYFMTVTEAVQLVLQAATMGRGSEIFVLDMGKPVRILDLARQMIRLAGLTPDEDVEVRFTGLRPGEKLSEELSLNSESVLPTYHPKILIFQGQTISAKESEGWVQEVRACLEARDAARLIGVISRLVPQYRPQGSRPARPGAAEKGQRGWKTLGEAPTLRPAASPVSVDEDGAGYSV